MSALPANQPIFNERAGRNLVQDHEGSKKDLVDQMILIVFLIMTVKALLMDQILLDIPAEIQSAFQHG